MNSETNQTFKRAAFCAFASHQGEEVMHKCFYNCPCCPVCYTIYRLQWVNCSHFIFLISCIYIVSFWFYWSYSIIRSVGYHLWVKQLCDAIQIAINLETTYRAACHSGWKFQYKHFIVFGCQCENILREIKIKHPINIMVFWVITSDGNIMPTFIFPHGSHSAWRLHQVSEGSSTALHQKGDCWKFVSGKFVSHRSMENPVMVERQFLWLHHP